MSDYGNRFKCRLIDGRLTDPWDPVGPAPSPETVAYGLANLCRYGGHVKRFYSVCEHSLWVAMNLACGGSDNERFATAANLLADGFTFTRAFELASDEQARLAILGLIHDAPEGCGLVDVPGPVLRHEEMTPYKRAHERCAAWLCRAWGLPEPPWPDEIKAVDYSILGAELAIRPDNAEETAGSGESVPRWPNLDLFGRHVFANFRARDAWIDAYRALKVRIAR